MRVEGESNLAVRHGYERMLRVLRRVVHERVLKPSLVNSLPVSARTNSPYTWCVVCGIAHALVMFENLGPYWPHCWKTGLRMFSSTIESYLSWAGRT